MLKPGLGLAFLVLVLLPLGGVGRAADRTAFIAGVEDLPLVPGVKVVSDTVVAFDAAAGRIVEAYAIGPVAKQAVLDFYGKSLPQLGWTAERPDRFVRQGEALQLDFFGRDQQLTVRFTLAPQ
jgi:hypothetical protein